MRKEALRAGALLLTLALLLPVAGCQGGADGPVQSSAAVQSAGPSMPKRDAAPRVLVPEAPGTETLGNDKVWIDVSNRGEGYITVRYDGDNDKVKLQITCGEGETYTYNLQKDVPEVFPLTAGDGQYRIGVYENISGTKYSQVFSGEQAVALDSEFGPFLYPNQYVDFDEDSQAVAKGAQLAEGAADELEVVGRIYDFVVGEIRYDYDKADNPTSNYLPDIDETLQSRMGICFDYAALMTAMLRTQRIPTKLVIGYVGELYHAWISVYIEGQGWINNIIYFDGEKWTRMDPTMASTGGGAQEYVGDGKSYHELYYY